MGCTHVTHAHARGDSIPFTQKAKVTLNTLIRHRNKVTASFNLQGISPVHMHALHRPMGQTPLPKLCLSYFPPSAAAFLAGACTSRPSSRSWLYSLRVIFMPGSSGSFCGLLFRGNHKAHGMGQCCSTSSRRIQHICLHVVPTRLAGCFL